MHFSLERRKPPEYVLYTDKVRTGPVPQPVPVQGACFCVQGTYFSVLEYVLFSVFWAISGLVWFIAFLVRYSQCQVVLESISNCFNIIRVVLH